MIFQQKSFLSLVMAQGRLFPGLLFAVAMFFGMAVSGLASGAESAEAHQGTGEHGLPRYAVPVYYGIGGHAPTVPGDQNTAKVGWGAVTNSMIVTWAVALFIILFAQVAMRNVRQVPEGAQNFWEWLVGGLYEFLEGIVGHELVKKTFWFFATIFIFILFTNWFGLVPGVGTVGWGEKTGPLSIGHVATPLLRGSNADFNMTFGMACVFFVCWLWWALRANGPGGFILHLFGPKGDTTGILKVLMIFVFIIVGMLEVVSILFRPVSLSFRLYGNIFAGENMLEAMAAIVPSLGWLIPIPFYFLELIVGLVQALVFMLLTAVFTLLICTHEEGHEH
jgi:F-type H+-transporting ATPase subunit a